MISQLLEIQELKNNFVTHAQIHSHNTRNKNQMVPPKHKLEITNKNTHNIHLYNKIPTEWKTLTQSRFKQKIVQYMKEGAFYTIKEFVDSLR